MASDRREADSLFDLGIEIADFSGKGRKTGSAEIIMGFCVDAVANSDLDLGQSLLRDRQPNDRNCRQARNENPLHRRRSHRDVLPHPSMRLSIDEKVSV